MGSRPKGKADVHLVQEQEYYGIERHDHTTVTTKKSSVSMVGQGSDKTGIDSGASDHMTYDRSYFTQLYPPPMSCVTNANDEAFLVLGMGSIHVTPSLELHNVFYVSALSHHLISVPQLNS